MTGWWSGMDLTAWCAEPQVGTSDMTFALTVANTRAVSRGVRQRVTRNHDFKVSPFAWIIGDVDHARLTAVAS